jgi:hypothetical protein
MSANIISCRKGIMKTQGGGFNRTQSSGYFKKRNKVLYKSAKMLPNQGGKQVFIEERQ